MTRRRTCDARRVHGGAARLAAALLSAARVSLLREARAVPLRAVRLRRQHPRQRRPPRLLGRRRIRTGPGRSRLTELPLQLLYLLPCLIPILFHNRLHLLRPRELLLVVSLHLADLLL